MVSNPIPSGLTDTQYRILKAAAINGTVLFARSDRKGTRVVKFDELGRPVMIAYSNPEEFLVKRGLLEPGNERHSYRITEAGRSKISR